MMKLVAVMVPAVAVLVGLSADRHVMASDSDVLARFDGGTGVIPVSSVAPPQNADLTFANVVQNVVRGVAPSGQPWTIADLKAIVHTDGRIQVVARPGPERRQPDWAESFSQGLRDRAVQRQPSLRPAFDQYDVQQPDPVQLDVNGDFRIDDTLEPVPSECASPCC